MDSVGIIAYKSSGSAVVLSGNLVRLVLLLTKFITSTFLGILILVLISFSDKIFFSANMGTWLIKFGIIIRIIKSFSVGILSVDEILV